ncbi:MAG: amidohydrolase family protein [Pirellulales bacterium]|nr:amidohydrolase family protein [Pirellulales bacterium]
MNPSRRQFIRQAAPALVSMGALDLLGTACIQGAESGTPATSPLLPVVDTHQHLWDLAKFDLPWLKSDRQLNRSFVTEDYREAVRGLGVVQAVYMEVAVAEGQQRAEAEHVVELCKRPDNPTVAAVIGGRPGADGFPEYIRRFQDGPHVKGVRQIIQRPAETVDGQFLRGIRLLGELGMSFDLCVPPTELAAAAKLVDQCPDTRFILDHCGNADPQAVRAAVGRDASDRAAALRRAGQQWRRDIAALARRRHVVCKISGIVARADKATWTPEDLAPTVDHCLEVFGPDRVMFGGDWPVCTKVASLRQWLEALLQIVGQRDQTQQRRLLHDNAVRFYGLAY